MNDCSFHDAHEHRILRSEKDIQDLFLEIKGQEQKVEKGIDRVHGRIDALKTSIISAMFVVIIQGILLGIKFVVG